MTRCSPRRLVAAASLAVAAMGLGACSALPKAASTSSTLFPAGPDQGFGPNFSTTVPKPFAVTGDFCADLRAFEQAEPATAAGDPTAAFGTLSALRAEAPPDLQDVFDLMAEVITELNSVSVNDQEGIQRAYTTLADPQFAAGLQRLSTYARNTCGVTLSGLGGLTPGAGGLPTGSQSQVTGG